MNIDITCIWIMLGSISINLYNCICITFSYQSIYSFFLLNSGTWSNFLFNSSLMRIFLFVLWYFFISKFLDNIYIIFWYNYITIFLILKWWRFYKEIICYVIWNLYLKIQFQLFFLCHDFHCLVWEHNYSFITSYIICILW